jgi:hypothetical protein
MAQSSIKCPMLISILELAGEVCGPWTVDRGPVDLWTCGPVDLIYHPKYTKPQNPNFIINLSVRSKRYFLSWRIERLNY